MAFRLRARIVMPTLAAAVTAWMGLGVAPTALASASTPQHCSLNISNGAYACSTGGARLKQGQAATATSSQYVLAVFYDDPNKNPADGTLAIFASGPCDTDSDVDWSVSVMPTGWNDRISSFDGYNHCEVKFWQNSPFAPGATYGPVASAYSLGSMGDEVSSMAFY
jgi:hypothetical protein